jgi:hypothetical protein
MAATPELPSGPSPEYSGPSIELNINGNKVALTWQNTVLRTFLTGGGIYDHIECFMPDGQCIGILMDFEEAETLKIFLEENSYPFRVDSVVENRTAEWYAEHQAFGLEDEWHSFTEHPDLPN